MDCRVVVEAAIPVYDVETAEEAVRIAISKTGEMLNPDLNYVEIEAGSRTAPGGEELRPAFVVANEALVALELEMTTFSVEREEHAARIARTEIGSRLENIPLDVLSVDVIDEDLEANEDIENTETDAESHDDPETDAESDDAMDERAEGMLPAFDELLEE